MKYVNAYRVIGAPLRRVPIASIPAHTGVALEDWLFAHLRSFTEFRGVELLVLIENSIAVEREESEQ